MPGFTKSERLCSKAQIETLFAEGRGFSVYPFKVIYQFTTPEPVYPAQILISVPKRNFRHAVTRNLIRRRIREIYRKHKPGFYQNLGRLNRKCLFALIYTGKEVLKSSALEPKIIVILQRLNQENVKASG
jgi:ribonuclease P protein component